MSEERKNKNVGILKDKRKQITEMNMMSKPLGNLPCVPKPSVHNPITIKLHRSHFNGHVTFLYASFFFSSLNFPGIIIGGIIWYRLFHACILNLGRT